MTSTPESPKVSRLRTIARAKHAIARAQLAAAAVEDAVKTDDLIKKREFLKFARLQLAASLRCVEILLDTASDSWSTGEVTGPSGQPEIADPLPFRLTSTVESSGRNSDAGSSQLSVASTEDGEPEGRP